MCGEHVNFMTIVLETHDESSTGGTINIQTNFQSGQLQGDFAPDQTVAQMDTTDMVEDRNDCIGV